jgi:transcriptional regulator with XRE-family HTH domain
MDVRIKIGQRIRELREKSLMSQKDLAYNSDLDRSYIAGIESGKRNVSILNIERIATALQVSLHEFFSCELFQHKS